MLALLLYEVPFLEVRSDVRALDVTVPNGIVSRNSQLLTALLHQSAQQYHKSAFLVSVRCYCLPKI
jgi:hypothetical protein